jgi:hypothetical protein
VSSLMWMLLSEVLHSRIAVTKSPSRISGKPRRDLQIHLPKTWCDSVCCNQAFTVSLCHSCKRQMPYVATADRNGRHAHGYILSFQTFTNRQDCWGIATRLLGHCCKHEAKKI